MKRFNKPFTALLISVLSLLLLTACGSAPQEPDSGIQSPQANAEAGSEFTPADTGVAPRDSFNLPYLGYTVSLPAELQSAMLDRAIYMGAEEGLSEDGSAVEYALLTWDSMTDEQKTQVTEATPEAFQVWLDGLTPVARLGVYDDAHAARLDELTGLTLHQHLGDRSGFHYYLSTSADAAAALVEQLEVRLYDAAPLAVGDSAFMVRKEAITNVGSFTMEDLNGSAYTEALFAENKLTLVNLFATWCSPCVREIPELETLSNNMKAQDVGVIGIVLDGVEAPDQARLLAEKTGATYPFLIPDSSLMNGRLIGVTAVPETFFVDSEGNIVGDVYPGARPLDEWTKIVELELSRLEAK